MNPRTDSVSDRGSRARKAGYSPIPLITWTANAPLIDRFAPFEVFGHLPGNHLRRNLHFPIFRTAGVLMVDLIAPAPVVDLVQLFVGRSSRCALPARENHYQHQQKRNEQIQLSIHLLALLLSLICDGFHHYKTSKYTTFWHFCQGKFTGKVMGSLRITNLDTN